MKQKHTSSKHISNCSNSADIIVFRELLDNAQGTLPVSMTNDYLFRALMQRSPHTLSALLSALLHLNPDDITQVTILNPIELGETIRDKEFLLDIKLELNRRSHINLEMQVINEKDWPERSLCYLCRTFDDLNRGEDYLEIRPAAQIGILNFTLFPDSPEFLSNYYLMNAKNHKIYSDKFRLTVLDLTQRNLATDEDIFYLTDIWAAFFHAATWEELKMLADQNTSLLEAAYTVRQLTMEDKIRLECSAREDYLRREATKAKRYAQGEAALQKLEQVEAKIKQAEAKVKQTEAEMKQAETKMKKTEAKMKQAETKMKKTEAKMKQTEAKMKQTEAERERLQRLLEKHGIDIHEELT